MGQNGNEWEMERNEVDDGNDSHGQSDIGAAGDLDNEGHREGHGGGGMRKRQVVVVLLCCGLS